MGNHVTDSSEVKALTSVGYCIVHPPKSFSQEKLSCLKNKVDSLFEDESNRLQISPGLYRLIDGLEKVPEIVKFIDIDLENIIESYFKSHFKIFGVYFYRTEPNHTMPKSSFLWHFDNCPNEEIKLMIYLNDVFEDTGAMRIKNKSLTERLKKRGFIRKRIL